MYRKKHDTTKQTRRNRRIHRMCRKKHDTTKKTSTVSAP